MSLLLSTFVLKNAKLTKPISLNERRNKFKGKYLTLKAEFLKKKSVWKQREFVLNSYAGNK
jgi:hypothetical protein